MAAKKPKTDRAPITAAQRRQILDLYVYGLAEAPEIAEATGLSPGSVRALVRPLLAVRQRFWGSEEMLAKSAAHVEEMAGYRATVEVDCAKLGTIRIKGQIVSASNLLSQAVQAKSPEEVRAVARALGPASQDVTSGRLAVGLSTEKVTVDDARADEFRSKFFELVVSERAMAAAERPAGGPPGVEQGDGSSAEPVAGTSRS